MRSTAISLATPDEPEAFLSAAAALIGDGVEPAMVSFVTGENTADLFAAPAVGFRSGGGNVAQEARAELETMLLHRSTERHALAYRLLWRLGSQPQLFKMVADKDVARARQLTQSVKRDMHKMKAFVRFRETQGNDGSTRFVSWFEPQHYIVRRVAPFFAGRFAGMTWSILTPDLCAHWDGARVSFSPGARRDEAPDGDPLEDVWRTYYASTFNPARLKPKAMMAHMPKKYWHNLPEAELIAPLIREAQTRSAGMIEAAATRPRRTAAAAVRPTAGGCAGNKDTLDACTRCDLYKHATQAVPGEGPANSRLMLVGEQPGDKEDIAGKPFVGPAGKVLDAALEKVGVARAECFVTNAVKHFKFESRGKARLHKSPSTTEIDRCRWWLDIERETVKPKVIVALGVTALRGITGKSMTLTSIRARPTPLDDGATLLATVHPSFLLRLQDEQQKREEWRKFLADLEVAKGLLTAA